MTVTVWFENVMFSKGFAKHSKFKYILLLMIILLVQFKDGKLTNFVDSILS